MSDIRHIKQLVMSRLATNGATATLSARTVSFADLARASCVFVTVSNLRLIVDEPEYRREIFASLDKLARQNDFRVEVK